MGTRELAQEMDAYASRLRRLGTLADNMATMLRYNSNELAAGSITLDQAQAKCEQVNAMLGAWLFAPDSV